MTSAVEVAIVLGLVIAGIGVLASRVDVVLIALPLLASAAIAFDRRPAAGTRSTIRVEVARSADQDGKSEFEYRIAVEATEGTDLVHLRVTPQNSFSHELVLAPRDLVVAGRVPIAHSGRQRVLDVSYRLIGATADGCRYRRQGKLWSSWWSRQSRPSRRCRCRIGSPA